MVQSENGTFIHQTKYAIELLKKFYMENRNSVSTPMVPGQKFVKEDVAAKVDGTTTEV